MQSTSTKFIAPNGIRFLLAVSDGCGVWHCEECGAEGFTALNIEDAEREAKSAAVEHSHVCPASRGHGEVGSAPLG
jgi:hypothetical protein